MDSLFSIADNEVQSATSVIFVQNQSNQCGSLGVPECLVNNIDLCYSFGNNPKTTQLAASSQKDLYRFDYESDEPQVKNTFEPNAKTFPVYENKPRHEQVHHIPSRETVACICGYEIRFKKEQNLIKRRFAKTTRSRIT